MGNRLELFKQWQATPTDGKTKAFVVPVPGSDNRGRQEMLQNSGNMEGAVTFPRSHINIDLIQRHVHGVEEHGAQNGAIYLGEVGLSVHGQGQLWLVKINDLSLLFIDFLDDLQRGTPTIPIIFFIRYPLEIAR